MSTAHVICVSAYRENYKMESIKMTAIFTGLLFLSLSYLFQVNGNNDCDCYNDVVSGPFDEVTVTICPDAKRVRSLEFRLLIDPRECDAILHIYTQELTDMEIYMNNLYTCPSVGHADRHCDPTFCSVGLSYPYYSPIEAETPGNITLQTSDSFDFFFRNITMFLRCATKDDGSYNETFEVVFRRNLTKTVTSESIIVPQTTSHDGYVSDSSKNTPANMIQTEARAAIERQKQATHRNFFDDSVNVALVSAVSVVGFLGSMTVILYYLVRRLCKSVTVFPGRTSGNEEETNNDVPAGHLGRIRRNKD